MKDYRHWLTNIPLSAFGNKAMMICNFDFKCMSLNRNTKMINLAVADQTFDLPHVKASGILKFHQNH